MDNRTALIVSSLTFIAGIGIGHFTANTDSTNNLSTTQPAEASANIASDAHLKVSADTPANAKDMAAAAKMAFSNKENHSSTAVATNGQSTQEATTPVTTSSTENKPANKDRPNEITEEDIDRAIPVPFNNSLKNMHGPLREKYKDFMAANQPDDWDVRQQNKINDFILSSPYAKFINLEFLACKAGLCEIRLYETKPGTFSLILSEMALQDWWDIGGHHASGNQAGDGRTAYHVLLPRK